MNRIERLRRQADNLRAMGFTRTADDFARRANRIERHQFPRHHGQATVTRINRTGIYKGGTT